MSITIRSPSVEATAQGAHRPVTPAAAGPAARQAAAASPTDGGEGFRGALHSLGRAIDTGEKLVRRALTPSVGQLGAAELIALQAGIYRYSEAIDLAAKLVDRAGAAIRTTLQAGQ